MVVLCMTIDYEFIYFINSPPLKPPYNSSTQQMCVCQCLSRGMEGSNTCKVISKNVPLFQNVHLKKHNSHNRSLWASLCSIPVFWSSCPPCFPRYPFLIQLINVHAKAYWHICLNEVCWSSKSTRETLELQLENVVFN